MPEIKNENRDLVLAPNEYAYISDQTKGKIDVYVGPHKTSLAQTDKPVVFDEVSKRFIPSSLETAIKTFATAPEGWYLILKNPAKDDVQPKSGSVSQPPDLLVGRKVNITGPRTIALWPGQMVKVVEGHHLRSNQYLLVRVYDEEGARKNWSDTVMKLNLGDSGDSGDPNAQKKLDTISKVDLSHITMGKLFLIKGTEVSFYLPPTGVEVVRDENKNYVRDAETLERLEYSILLDENGNKRYVRGPTVIFPEPTEKFLLNKDNKRKFKAVELNEISGIYVKVIADYQENEKEYKVGDELFITGKDQMIYFPREEHAIIKYADDDAKGIHYAIAVPEGETRYYLDRIAGKIIMVRGPVMFLPDPKNQVVIKRILSQKEVGFWYPENAEAAIYNKQLETIKAELEGAADRNMLMAANYISSRSLTKTKAHTTGTGAAFGDELKRNNSYTPPRTITLDTKYEGAPKICPWTGYAVQIVNSKGQRKVITGPAVYHLEYDEVLEGMELSTGTPKSDSKTIKTVYLRVLNNKVSDIIDVETKDLCNVKISLSYRINFEGDPSKWFNVENYVKFLTDHLRSVIRNTTKQHGIEEFYANSINIIRDTVLGKHAEEGRVGKVFSENGMRVYDVEVLDVRIGDAAIASLLIDTQNEVVKQTLDLAKQQRSLELTKETERVKQEAVSVTTETTIKKILLDIDVLDKKHLAARAEETNEKNLEIAKFQTADEAQKVVNLIHTQELDRKKATEDLNTVLVRHANETKIQMLNAETNAIAERTKAIAPELIAALQSLGDTELVIKAFENLNVLKIAGGGSMAEVFNNIFKGTKFEGMLAKVVEKVASTKK